MYVNNSNKLAEIEPLRFKSVYELYATPEESVPFVVEDLLPSSGLSVLAGKPKAGKSTLARQLAVAVAQGKPFLGKSTEPGHVLYVALEEKQSEITSHFNDLGLTSEDEVSTYCEVAPRNAIGALEGALKTMKGVRLVVIDPLFKFIRVKDGNDYVVVNNAIEPLLTLARSYGVHIMVVHHKKKRVSEDSMDDVVPTNILVQFEMIELIEGFLLVFPAHVYSSFLRNFQHPIVVAISRSPAG